jgi:hypothetical protein
VRFRLGIALVRRVGGCKHDQQRGRPLTCRVVGAFETAGQCRQGDVPSRRR